MTNSHSPFRPRDKKRNLLKRIQGGKIGQVSSELTYANDSQEILDSPHEEEPTVNIPISCTQPDPVPRPSKQPKRRLNDVL